MCIHVCLYWLVGCMGLEDKGRYTRDQIICSDIFPMFRDTTPEEHVWSLPGTCPTPCEKYPGGAFSKIQSKPRLFPILNTPTTSICKGKHECLGVIYSDSVSTLCYNHQSPASETTFTAMPSQIRGLRTPWEKQLTPWGNALVGSQVSPEVMFLGTISQGIPQVLRNSQINVMTLCVVAERFNGIYVPPFVGGFSGGV
jgi:hypothetical protein